MSDTRHIAVIGGGPGGYAAAFHAASRGFRTTLIDTRTTPGGVCLHVGCIPSKALLHVAKLLGETGEAGQMGLDFGKAAIDREKLAGWKESVVERLTGGLLQQCKRRGVEFIQGRARYKSSTLLEIELGDGGRQELAVDHSILASGSRPSMIPGVEAGAKIWNSTGGLSLETIPKSLLVVGGGYIGLELGSVYASLGSKVDLVEMTDGLLPGADRDLVRVLSKRVSKTFNEQYFQTKVLSLKEQKKGVAAVLELPDGKEQKKVYERVLVSIGRRPNSEDLGLEHTAVEVSDRGFVQVDDQLKTADAAISAIGDVVGDPMLAHKASHEARVAVEVIDGKKSRFEPACIPAVVFTDPELGWVGITENEAKAQGREVKVSRFPWGASGRALSLERTDGVCKVIADPETDRVLGLGVVGVGAGELVAEGALAIEMGAVVEDLALTIHPHPTLSETIMEAAEVYYGHSAHYFTGK